MSPEYRVEIVAPYIYKVQAENERAAAEKALELFGDGHQGIDPLAPAEVESVEELKVEHGAVIVAAFPREPRPRVKPQPDQQSEWEVDKLVTVTGKVVSVPRLLVKPNGTRVLTVLLAEEQEGQIFCHQIKFRNARADKMMEAFHRGQVVKVSGFAREGEVPSRWGDKPLVQRWVNGVRVEPAS